MMNVTVRQVLVVVILGMGAAAWIAQAPAAEKPVVVDKQSDGKTVEAVVGQPIEIQVTNSGGTGFAWSLEKIEGDAVKSLGGPVTVAAVRIPGGRVQSAFSFKAEKVGKSEVTLVLRRAWESGKPPAETLTVTLDVKAKEGVESPKVAKNPPLILSNGANGRDYTVPVDREIEIRLNKIMKIGKWNVIKTEGESLKSVGKVESVDGKPSGIDVFRYTAAKAGKTVLTFEFESPAASARFVGAKITITVKDE